MTKKTLPFIYPLVMAVWGAVLGLAAGVTMWTLYTCIDLVWHGLPHLLHIPEFHPAMILTLTLAGGLLVGLCQRTFGDYPIRMEDAMKTFRETGKFDYKHMPQGLTTSFVSLISGGSLGPEAALVAMVGGGATWFSQRMKSMLIRRELVDITSPDEPLPKNLKRSGSIAGWIAGVPVFVVFAMQIFGGGMLGEFVYHFRGIDLLLAIPVGLIGGLGGVIYLSSDKALKNWLRDIDPLILALGAGLILGIAAIAAPEILFSGNHDLPLLVTTDQVWYAILLIGLGKILMTALLLSSGWKGGQFLPIMFGGSALGISLSLLFPSISPVVGAVGGMAALTTVTMGNPLIVSLIVLSMVQDLRLAGVIIVGALAGYGVAQLYRRFAADEADQPEVAAETQQASQALS